MLNGAINFNGPVTTKNLVASGTVLNANNAIAGEKLTFNAGQSFTLGSGASLSATGPDKNLTINSAGLINLNGATRGNVVTITSGTNRGIPGALTFNGTTEALSSLVATGPSVAFNGSLSGKDATFNAGTSFRAGNGSVINLGGNASVTASDSIILDGTITTAGSLGLNGLANIVVNGAVNSADVNIAGTNVTLAGPISARNFTVNNKDDLLLSASGNLRATDSVSLTAVNNVTLNGAASGKNFSITAGKDLTTNAAIQTPGAFVANVKNATVNQALQADLATFTTGTNFTLGATGSISTTKDIAVTSLNGDILLRGTTNSAKLTLSAAKGNVTMNDRAQTQSIGVSGKKAIVGGPLESAADMVFTMTQDFILNGSGSLGAGGNVTISGQRITLDGGSSGKTFKLTGTKELLINGTVNSADFQANAAGATINSVVTSGRNIGLSLSGDLVTGAASNLSAVEDIQANTTGSASLAGGMNGRDLSVSATGDLHVATSANLQASRALVLAAADTQIFGRLVAPTLTLTGTDALLFNASTAYLSADYLTLNSSNGVISLASANGGVAASTPRGSRP